MDPVDPGEPGEAVMVEIEAKENSEKSRDKL
jgi:hypothetical protein